jgi:hypothetical protein
MDVASLQRQMRNGANNFFWIAALSIANSIFFLISTRSTFVVGLGITQFIDTIFHNISLAYPNSTLLIRCLGLLPDILFCGVFVLCGFLALRGYRWGFIAGLILFGLDAILTLISSDIFGFGFHLFFLWFLIIGLRALNNLEKIKMEISSGSSPTQ